MITYFDKQKLDSLVKNIHNITNLTVAIYDNSFNIISSSQKVCSDFCKIIRKNGEINKKCIKSDNTALEKCKKLKKPYYYHCHIGLSELAVPIVHNDIIIGFMLLGQSCQIDDKPMILENACKIADQCGISFEDIGYLVENINLISNEYISSLSEVLQMAVEYIWLNNIIGVQKISLIHSIETYIQNNIQNDLSIGKLCEVFNVSSSTLFNISKKKFGLSMQSYIINTRINTAKELLKKGHTVIETAKAVGFSDDNYFIRCFKKYTGITPKQFQLSENT